MAELIEIFAAGSVPNSRTAASRLTLISDADFSRRTDIDSGHRAVSQDENRSVGRRSRVLILIIVNYCKGSNSAPHPD